VAIFKFKFHIENCVAVDMQIMIEHD